MLAKAALRDLRRAQPDISLAWMEAKCLSSGRRTRRTIGSFTSRGPGLIMACIVEAFHLRIFRANTEVHISTVSRR